MSSVSINDNQVTRLIEYLKTVDVPEEQESSTHSYYAPQDLKKLANCYLAIVAICHQTSPLGERRLIGVIENNEKVGWDYLKEKFLAAATTNDEWTSFSFWKTITPLHLSELYQDSSKGLTLNRINERTFLLNDLGNQLTELGYNSIEDAFEKSDRFIDGPNGFLTFLKNFESFKDPVLKKSLFLLSIMAKECGWQIKDIEQLKSPVDYHELRGHLRIGTVHATSPALAFKLKQGITLTEEEDTILRSTIQIVNDRIANETGLTSSIVHYLFWNIFRNCCPRDSSKTHCHECISQCGLPRQYKSISAYKQKCLFSEVCLSVDTLNKIIDPPYMGHYS
jgi:hypothetical protein